jgi:hypothetical protein
MVEPRTHGGVPITGRLAPGHCATLALMTDHAALASPDEMRAHLVDELNLMLRRPGMYGDVEDGLRLAMNHLLFLERRPHAWGDQRGEWSRQGVCTPTGVRGALRPLLPSNAGYGVASIYAEFARRQGWLATDRLLEDETYTAMRQVLPQWVGQDRVWGDVTEAFGPPSVLFGGSNPHYGKTLGYAAADAAKPMVSFHLWNGTAPGQEPSWPPLHAEPVLLAVRCGDGPFGETFAFTPYGQRFRSAASAGS